VTQPIDTAYVEIKPETGGFTRNLRRDVDRAFSDVSRDVDRHTNKIRNSLSSAFGSIGGALRAVGMLGMLVTKLVAVAGAAGAVSAALAGIASAIGGGIQSLIGLVQVATQAAGALLLIPGALAILASAFATIKIGFGGIGAAFKEAGAAAGGGASQVEGAEHRIALAQRAAKAAQEDLTRARKAAQEEIEDLARSLKGARLDEEGATLAVEDALKSLQAAQRSGDPDAIKRADLAYRQAQQTLEDVTDRVGDLSEASEDANKNGVEGSDAVQAALQRQADATYELAQAQKAATASAGGMASAMSKLAPNAQAFVRAVLALKPAFNDLKLSVQNALFKDLGAAFTQMATTQLPVLQTGLTNIAKELNTGIIAAFRELGTEASKADFASIFGSAATVVHNLAAAVRPLLHALRDIVTVSAEAVAGLTGGLGAWADKFQKKIAEMRASGELKALIDDGITALKTLFGLLKDILGIFGGLAKAAGGSDGLFGFFDKLNKLINSVKGQDALSKIFASLGEIGEALLPVLLALAQALVPVAKGIAAIAVAFAPTLVVLAEQLGSALASLAPAIIALAPSVASLGNALAPLAKILVDLVIGAAPGIKAFMDGLGAGLKALVPVAPIVGQALGAILQLLGALIAAIGPILAPLLQSLADLFIGLSAVLTPLITIFAEIASAIAAELVPVFNTLLTTMLPMIIQLGKDFAESFRPLIPVIVQIAKVLAAKFLAQLPKMVAFFEKLAPIILDVGVALAQYFLAALEEILPVLPDLIDSFFDMVDAAREILLAVLPLIPSFIKLLAQILPIITNHKILIPLIQSTVLAMQLFAQILQIVVPILEKIIGFVSNTIGVFKGLSSPLSTITGALSKVGGAFGIFGKKTKDGMGVAATAVSTSVGTIKGKLNPLGGIGEAAGKAVAQGLIDGMNKKKHELQIVANAVAAIVIGAAQAALQLGSPSKVFMEMGKDTVAGYIVGLKKSTAGLRTAVSDIITGDVTQIAGQTNIDQSINFGENAINMRFAGDANTQTAMAAGLNTGRSIAGELARRRNIRVAVRTA
jgi:hypothetical protein